MTIVAKTAIANVLFFVALLCTAVGVFLLSGDPIATAVAVVAAGAFMKFDDHRIRKSRRTI